MKLFFTGSPRALRVKQYKKNLNSIFEELAKYGDHTSTLVIKNDPEKFYNYSEQVIDQHYENTINNLKKADVIIVEVTMHSMSMGFLVNKGLELSKPTICLYSNSKPPFFLSGIKDPNLLVIEYSNSNIEEVIFDAFEYISGKRDKRFNLMLSPTIFNSLNEISKKKRIPKSQIIRQAILELVKKENISKLS
jgi:hypothetical protein